MIRINLLSSGPKGRPAKPQYDVRAQLLLGVGLLAITLSACWWYSVSLDDEIAARQTEKADKEKQVAQLTQQSPMVDISIFFDDWREVDGVQFPHLMRRASAGTTNEEWTISKVRINPKIDAKKFAADTK